MSGVKHLIECHCFLKIFNQKSKKINHKFPTYSKFDKNNDIVPKLAKCNNCESVHYIYDLCKSELRPGKESIETVINKEDMIMMLPDKIANVLIKNDADISDFEHALDIIEEEDWGSYLIVKRSIVEEEEQVKVLQIESEDKIKIFSRSINTTIVGEK